MPVKNPDIGNVTGLASGAYAGAGYGVPGMIGGGAVGYAAPMIGYGMALWRTDHKILAGLVWALPFIGVGYLHRRR
jgi:hypothetical protein